MANALWHLTVASDRWVHQFQDSLWSRSGVQTSRNLSQCASFTEVDSIEEEAEKVVN